MANKVTLRFPTTSTTVDVKYLRCSSTIMQNIVVNSAGQNLCKISNIKPRAFAFVLQWIKHHMITHERDLTKLDEVLFDRYERELLQEANIKRLLFDLALAAKRLNINALYKSCCTSIAMKYPSVKDKIALIFMRVTFVDIKYLRCSSTIMDSIVDEKYCYLHPLKWSSFQCILEWIRHHVDEHEHDLTALDEVPFDYYEREHLLRANLEGKLFDVALSANWLNMQPLYKSCCKVISMIYPNTEEECLRGLVVREPESN